MAKKDSNLITEIEVKNLMNPIKIDIPLAKEVKNPENTQCMFLNEELDEW